MTNEASDQAAEDGQGEDSLEPASARAKPLPLRPPQVESPNGADSGERRLAPARMINEVLYCERLFYLEFVQSEWAENVFTTDGQVVHRKVNQEGRPLRASPAPSAASTSDEDSGREPGDEDQAGDERPYTARSVWLSSEKLGITAKLDVVEVEGGRVVPVEYKRGKRPELPEGAYLPELAQVCAQVLLLREHGYSCDHGELYYAKDHQRVTVAINDRLIRRTLFAAERIQALAEAGVLPPPLVDSPKCHGCSLVGICLPDETRALARSGRSADGARRRPFDGCRRRPVGVSSRHRTPSAPAIPRTRRQAARLRSSPRSNGTPGWRTPHCPKQERAAGRDAPHEHIARRHVRKRAHHHACHQEAPRSRHSTLFFSYGGWFIGQALSHDSKNVELRLAQYAATQDRERCLKLARGFVASKILNCRTLLRRNHEKPSPVALSELKQLARKAHAAESIESLLGIEGTAARRYFREFSGMLKGGAGDGFDLDGRNRRPPRDPINALLSFCYSLLTKEVSLAIRAVGLDGMLGFYHQPHFGRPSLALDLMEEFRPVIADSTVIGAINTGVVQQDDFTHAAGAVALTPSARKRLMLAFERRMDLLVTHPVFDYRISYRRVLEVQARLLSRVLLGELPRYPEFRIR